MKDKESQSGNEQPPGHGESPRGEATRERILLAARTVFARHPYNSASIRMIGKEGGIEYPLIHYYFPTKSDLFEAVVVMIRREFRDAYLSWLDGIEVLGPTRGLSVFLDRFIEFYGVTPEPIRIVVLNMSQMDKLEEIPGYRHFPELLDEVRHIFEERIRPRAGSEEVGMFINSFNNLAFTYLGADSCVAEVLGMDPRGGAYRAYVKDALTYLFLPRLKELIFAPAFGDPAAGGTKPLS